MRISDWSSYVCSSDLEYGSSFAEQNLRRMVQFAATFPDEQILVSLIRELSWTHFIALIPLKDPLQRDYYAQRSEEHTSELQSLMRISYAVFCLKKKKHKNKYEKNADINNNTNSKRLNIQKQKH